MLPYSYSTLIAKLNTFQSLDWLVLSTMAGRVLAWCSVIVLILWAAYMLGSSDTQYGLEGRRERLRHTWYNSVLMSSIEIIVVIMAIMMCILFLCAGIGLMDV